MSLDAISKVAGGANVYGTTEVKPVAAEQPMQQVQRITAPAYSNFDSRPGEENEQQKGGNTPSENTVKQAISDIYNSTVWIP